MVRKYIRRSNNKVYDIKTIVKALKALRESKKSMREVAKDYNMKISALAYHWRRHNKENIDIEENILRKRHTLRALSLAMEQELLSYVVMCAEVYSTVGSAWIRQMAYELAIENKVMLPQNWKKHKIAGKDWFMKFKERNKAALAQIISETTSLHKIIQAHRHKTETFNSTYNKILLKYRFQPKDVFVLEQCKIQPDEDVNEVKPDVESPSKKQDAQKSSTPKGKSSVTFVGTVSAMGQSIPPFYIFSYTRYHKHQLLQEAPRGSIAKSDPSGAMTKKIFLDYLKHMVEYVGCTDERPVLLLTEDRPYHISLGAIRFAKKNGIMILSYPPRIKSKVELLEQSMFPHVKKEKMEDIHIEEEIKIEEEPKEEPLETEESAN